MSEILRIEFICDEKHGHFRPTQVPPDSFTVEGIQWLAWGHQYEELTIADSRGRIVYPPPPQLVVFTPESMNGLTFEIYGKKLPQHQMRPVNPSFIVELKAPLFRPKSRSSRSTGGGSSSSKKRSE